ncbi:MAG: PleD family two-component system response regulator [Alphaproteobacteria bacterium]
MSARILVVDDIPANVRLLEAKLQAEYFEVIAAEDGPSALTIVAREMPDIILLDVMMPGMDGFEVCRRIKHDPLAQHIPIVMVTALSEPEDRVRGLESGADDFLTKPIDDKALFARVRSLVRLKMMTDEWRMREEISLTLGDGDGDVRPVMEIDASDARVAVVGDRDGSFDRMAQAISRDSDRLVHVPVISGGGADLDIALAESCEAVVINCTPGRGADPLRVLAHLRSQEQSRTIPAIVVVDDHDSDVIARCLDLGASDYLTRPVDANEAIARIRTQVRRFRYQHRLKLSYRQNLSMAYRDELTGVYNRRYLATHLNAVVGRMRDAGKPLSLLMLDIDHFKATNDRYGHLAGDQVLAEVADRVTSSLRGFDTVARFGGEEFVVVMPDTAAEPAFMVAERLRRRVADKPVVLADGEAVSVAISIGVATAPLSNATGESLLELADTALYQAKAAGRNRTVAAAPGSAPASARRTA